MQEDYTGLVIKTLTVGEADRLITILTDKKGIVSAFVKRAKSLKNSNASATQLFCYSKFSIYKGKNSNSVNSTSPIKVFFNINKDIEKLTVSQYFCELAMILAPNEVKSEDFLRLMLNSLHLLANTDKHTYLVKSVFELKSLCLSGYMPDLIGCKNCRKYADDFMYFNPNKGVIHCKQCNTDSKSVKLDLATLTAMRHIIYSEFNKIFSFTLPENKIRLLSDITQAYVLSITDKEFKTLNFLEQIR